MDCCLWKHRSGYSAGLGDKLFYDRAVSLFELGRSSDGSPRIARFQKYGLCPCILYLYLAAIRYRQHRIQQAKIALNATTDIFPYMSDHHTGRSPIHIIVDDRETRCGILDILHAMESVSVTVERLTCGDYAVGENLLFERKTLPDLAVSIKDGRVFRQGCKLAQNPRRGIIILEGTSRDLVSSGMRREALQGALITLSVFLGIPLLRSQNLQETARLMLYTTRQSQSVASGAFPRHGVRPRGKRRTQIHILQGLPGVGPERARTLLNEFGSIEAILTASTEALSSVRGIGEHTAKAIQWVVHEPDSGYDGSREDDDPCLQSACHVSCDRRMFPISGRNQGGKPMSEDEEKRLEVILEDMNGKFDLLLEGHATLEHMINEHRAETRQDKHELQALIKTSHDSLDEKIDATAQRLDDKIDATTQRLDDKIDATTQRLDDKIDGVRDDLKGDIRGVRKELKETREEMAAGFEMVGDKIEGHEQRIQQLERKVA